MSTRKKNEKKSSLSEEATGGASVSGAGKGGKKGIHMPWKKKVAPTLSVSSEPLPERPEDDPESRKESVSDVEERVTAECQVKMRALEEEVQKLISEKEEVIKKIVKEHEKNATESQTQLNLVKQQTELTLQAKTIELQAKDVTIRSLETDIKDQKRSLAQMEIELEQEKVRGQDRVCDLEDKLIEKEEIIEKLRVGLEKEKQLQKGSLTARQVEVRNYMQKQVRSWHVRACHYMCMTYMLCVGICFVDCQVSVSSLCLVHLLVCFHLPSSLSTWLTPLKAL